MNVGNLIQRISNAIIRQEGEPMMALNPGNLRGAPWSDHPLIKNGFWVPMSREQGLAGIAHVVALRVAMGQSLTQLISAWAPASDHNNTAAYIENVKNWAGIPDENAPLWSYIF